MGVRVYLPENIDYRVPEFITQAPAYAGELLDAKGRMVQAGQDVWESLHGQGDQESPWSESPYSLHRSWLKARGLQWLDSLLWDGFGRMQVDLRKWDEAVWEGEDGDEAYGCCGSTSHKPLMEAIIRASSYRYRGALGWSAICDRSLECISDGRISTLLWG